MSSNRERADESPFRTTIVMLVLGFKSMSLNLGGFLQEALKLRISYLFGLIPCLASLMHIDFAEGPYD